MAVQWVKAPNLLNARCWDGRRKTCGLAVLLMTFSSTVTMQHPMLCSKLHKYVQDSPVIGADDANQYDRAQDVNSCNAHSCESNPHEVEGLGFLCSANLKDKHKVYEICKHACKIAG